mmetsp:Transcript_19030/g.44405  ORF Transcript_19030/g.44405 Transcript_19030/m.44405 type:complete len:224 (+) Transcript_19030:1058-1729(+)
MPSDTPDLMCLHSCVRSLSLLSVVCKLRSIDMDSAIDFCMLAISCTSWGGRVASTSAGCEACAGGGLIPPPLEGGRVPAFGSPDMASCSSTRVSSLPDSMLRTTPPSSLAKDRPISLELLRRCCRVLSTCEWCRSASRLRSLTQSSILVALSVTPASILFPTPSKSYFSSFARPLTTLSTKSQVVRSTSAACSLTASNSLCKSSRISTSSAVRSLDIPFMISL